MVHKIMGENIDNKIIEEIEDIIKNEDDVDPDVARRLQLSISLENHKQLLKINGRLKKAEAAVDVWEKNPSLLWLLRYKTKATVTAIIITFVILSVIYVSGTRAIIFEALGLPPLVP